MASLSIGLNAGVRPSQFSALRDATRPGARAETTVANKAGADAQGSGAEGTGAGPRGRTPRPVGQAEAGQDTNATRGQSEVGADGLTQAERDQVAKLRARDAEVRRHEEAHARVGGQYAGQPSYSYQTGPDGKRYAIGGEVPIDVSPIPGDPEATIDKMGVVKRAALAPAEPSGQDRRVAALADRQSLAAQAELNAQRLEEQAARFEDTGAKDTGAGVPNAETQSAAPVGGLLKGLEAVTRGPDTEPGGKLTKAA